MDLKGRRALISGASKGIGRATAEVMAELGADLVLLARDEAALLDLKKSLPRSERHATLALDVSDLERLGRAVSELTKTQPIEILVCNAGGPKSGPMIEASIDEFEKAFRTHLLANHTLVQKLVPGMKQSGYGRIINIISTSVKTPLPNLGVSNTIRASVASWAKTLAMELGPFGITVNNVLPGYTSTERLDQLLKGAADKQGVSVEQVEKTWKSTIPLGRFAESKETAQAIAFLASPWASYVSGINLPVDGGRTPSL